MPDGGLSRKPQIADLRHGGIAGPYFHGLDPILRAICATSSRNIVSWQRLFIACAGAFSNSLRATEGAPEVVLGGPQEFPRSRGRGEGAKKLSSVPGGHILGGDGEPAQLFWLRTAQTFADRNLFRTNSAVRLARCYALRFT